jgi:hypothetical protein
LGTKKPVLAAWKTEIEAKVLPPSVYKFSFSARTKDDSCSEEASR